MTTDIIIPNYNGSNLLKKNLPSVLKLIEKKDNAHIYIIDDASEKAEQLEAENLIKSLATNNISFIKNEKNLGFSSTVNKGVRKSNADYVFLLNTDAAPAFKSFHQIEEKFKGSSLLFGVGCLDRSIEGKKIIERGRGIAKWEKGFLRHRRGEVDSEDTFWISGGSSVIDRNKFLEIGGFDELFNPFYWEDIDLSYRARKAGYEIIFDKRCVVEHSHAEGAIKKNYSEKHVKKIAFRNELQFIWKNITDTRLLFSHFTRLVPLLILTSLRGQMYFLEGFFLALIRLPAILSKRSRQKKSYKKSDTELLDGS